MNLSMGYGKADKKERVQLLNECIDAGYTLLDTASMYGMGHNEELIGKTLSHRRDEYLLAIGPIFSYRYYPQCGPGCRRGYPQYHRAPAF